MVQSRLLAGLVVALVMGGCNTKTQKQIYDESRPAADVLRAKLVAAAAIVDKKPPTPATSACRAPKKLTFDPKSDAHDTDFMMLQEAKRGGGKADDKIKDEDLDLHFPTNPFPRVMRGTSPNTIYASYITSETATSDFIDTTRRGLHVKNVVLVRELPTGDFDYFLVDLAPAAPVVMCAGTFSPTSNPKLGAAHTQEYVTITTNTRTGKEVKRTTSSVTTDPRRAALYEDANTQLALHMKKELGLPAIE